MWARGTDLSWAFSQIMATTEYFRAQGATNAGFVQAATMDLLGRPASPDELATTVRDLDNGGAPARSRFLRDLIGGREFRLSRTQDAFDQFLGTPSTPGQRASALQAFRGPLGHSRMLARVVGGADQPGIIPTFEENAGPSLKRVPGFLAGAMYHNLAAPFDFANLPERKIDDKTVDYWAITLNQNDSVILTIRPEDGLPDTDFGIRIWGPDNKEIGANKGPAFAYVARSTGTHIIAISTLSNIQHAFDPGPEAAKSTGPAPTPRSFTAEFQTYPGDNTKLLEILLNYQNDAYGMDNWPEFSAAEQRAYDVLTPIARTGAQPTVDVPALRNFNDFRQVNETNADVMTGWLAATWAPFADLLK